MTRPQFASLQTLELCVGKDLTVKAVMKVIRKKLPLYAQLIRVSHW